MENARIHGPSPTLEQSDFARLQLVNALIAPGMYPLRAGSDQRHQQACGNIVGMKFPARVRLDHFQTYPHLDAIHDVGKALA